MSERQGHLKAQPGLRGHSVNPDDNKLKQYLVYIVLPLEDGGGLLARTSFDSLYDAAMYRIDRLSDGTHTKYLIVDQFDKCGPRGKVAFSEDRRFEPGVAL